MSRWSGVKVDGLKDIERVMNQLPKALGKGALTRVGKRRLEPMRDSAKARAPEDEGKLKASIIVSTQQGRGGSSKKTRGIDRAAVEVFMGPSEDGYPQAVPQEMGSPHNAPQGYMRGAWDEHNGGLLTGIQSDLSDEVDRTAKRFAKRQARRG
jgi:hypothetical protein